MEIILENQTDKQVAVQCDGQFSHIFDSTALPQVLDVSERKPTRESVQTYGEALFAALFPIQSLAMQVLNTSPQRLLLVTDEHTNAVAWEYLHGPHGFLVLDMPLVRGLPATQRHAPPTLTRSLHIVAVPSNPLDPDVPPLNINGEWQRLKEVIQQVPATLTLEYTRPPTLEHLRHLVTGQQQRVIHFMGHGSAQDQGAVLSFEQPDGGLASVTARDFIRRTKDTTFLVTLNACVSATPGETVFANLANALVQHGTPYALGMRFKVHDSDARTLSRVLYSELVRGSSVEEAVQQARLELANSPQPWAVGVPVLYTSLDVPAAGFTPMAGHPRIVEHQPPRDLLALPRAEGTFHGRRDTIREIGSLLTGDSCPRLLTIHGSGGQGKTALAREVVERFAYTFPGGVLAIALDALPTREQAVRTMARFLNIDLETTLDPTVLERQVLGRLEQQRILLVLDNAETLIQQVEAADDTAYNLADLLRYTLPQTQTTLLATSRNILGWTGEHVWHLEGLQPTEGRRLFHDSASHRTQEADDWRVQALSEQVLGHPLSLRLLGSAFGRNDLSFAAFTAQYEEEVLQAEDIYRPDDHRQRSIYASIATSVRFLDDDLRALLGGLWIFHAPFLPEDAVAIFDPKTHDSEGQQSPVYDRLHQLMLHSLLEIEVDDTGEDTLVFYRLHPTIRLFAEQHMQPPYARDDLLRRFGGTYFKLSETLYRAIDFGVAPVIIARHCAIDLDRGMDYVSDAQRGWYALYRGRIVHVLDDPHRGLRLAEQAAVTAGEHDQTLRRGAFYAIASFYSAIGQPQEALAFHEQNLAHLRAANDQAGEAATLSGLGSTYQALGQPEQALEYYEQALPLRREVDDRAGEAATLNNIGEVYRAIGKPQEALPRLEAALGIRRAIHDRRGEAAILNNLAATHQSIGHLEQARDHYQQSLSINREMGDHAREASILNNLAVVLALMGQSHEALLRLTELEIADNPVVKAATLISMGDIYKDTGQLQKAQEHYKDALSIARDVNNRVNEATALYKLGETYVTTGQRQRALPLYKQALSIWEEIGGHAGRAVTLLGIARMYKATGHLQQALDHYNQALTIITEVDDRLNEAVALDGIGEIYCATGQLQRARERFEQALSKARAVSYRAGEATTLNNLGEVHRLSGDLRQALECFEQALSIRKAMKDGAGEAVVLNNMALVSLASSQPQQALERCERALPKIRAASNRAGEAAVLNNMAGIYQQQGQSQQALGCFEQALSVQREIDDRMGIATSLHNIGGVYHTTGQVQQALEHYTQALSLRREMNDAGGEAETLALLAGLHNQHLHDRAEAAVYLRQAITRLETAGLDRTPSGTTLPMMREWLAAVQHTNSRTPFFQPILTVMHEWWTALQRRRVRLPTDSNLSVDHIESIISTTIAVLTDESEKHQEKHHEWCMYIGKELQQAWEHGLGWQHEIEFYTAVFSFLDGNPVALPKGHPYAGAVAAIAHGITT